MNYLREQNMISAEDMRVHGAFMRDYAQGVLDFRALSQFRHQMEVRLTSDFKRINRPLFEQDVLMPALAPLAGDLLACLSQNHLAPVLVSATERHLVEPVARYLGIDHVICPCFGLEKVLHVQAWLNKMSLSLQTLGESWFFSDSCNDLPLLEAVDHPVVVDADPTLLQMAASKGWRSISLRASALESLFNQGE